MSDSINYEESKVNDKSYVYDNITAYDFAIKLKQKIEEYGGYKGVWELIDPSFKRKESLEKIKTLNRDTKISKDTFRKNIERLVNEKLKGEKMTLSVKGNTLLLLHILEILKIKSLSDLMGVSFKTKTLEQLAIDINSNVWNMTDKLNRIDDNLKLIMKKKPRFTVGKVSNDWFVILHETKAILNTTIVNLNGFNSQEPININIFYSSTWFNFYINSLSSPHFQFAIRFTTMMNKYRIYFYNDNILNEFSKILYPLEKDNYYRKNYIFFLSPLFALYFIVLIYKRYLYCLSISNEIKENGGKFSFISDSNIKNKKRFLDKRKEENNNNTENLVLEDDYLGRYIYKQMNMFIIKLKHILGNAIKFQIGINEVNYQDYLNKFNGIFSIIYEINLNFTKINEEWIKNNIFKINSLKELYNRMILGIANLSLPSDDHIDNLDSYIGRLKDIGDMLDQDRKIKNG